MWIETFPRYAHVVLSPYTPPEASGAIRDMRGGRGNIWCMRAPDTCRFALAVSLARSHGATELHVSDSSVMVRSWCVCVPVTPSVIVRHRMQRPRKS